MKILNIIKRKKKNPQIKINEKVRIAGHLFSVLDPMQMNNIRATRFMLEEYEREWGMTKNDLLAIDDFLLSETKFPEKAANLGELNAALADKLKRIYAIVAQRQAVLKEDYQYKPFLQAASIIILLDDEPEDSIIQKYQAKKMELCQMHPEIEAFFLRVIRVFQLNITNSSDMSKISTWYPSIKLKHTENNLLKKINTNIYEIGEQ